MFLSGKLKTSQILPIYQFSRESYYKEQTFCIKKIQSLVIQSSSQDEDQVNGSGASKYKSCLNVDKYKYPSFPLILA